MSASRDEDRMSPDNPEFHRPEVAEETNWDREDEIGRDEFQATLDELREEYE